MNPKISVIIPVYNTENYLRECLDSILAQTFTDFEVLVINDGSTDGSVEICDEYAQKDARVKVFHKENGGVSSARNLGLDNAKGEWIAFVDSDDLLLDNALKNYFVITERESVDIIFSDYIVKSEHSQTVTKLQDSSANLDNISLIKDILDGKIHGSLCNKFIKRKILEHQRLNSEISYMEDKLLLIQLLLESPRVLYMNKPTYVYNQNNDSVTNKLTRKSLQSIKRVNDILNDTLDNTVFSEYIFKMKYRYKMMLLMNLESTAEIKNSYSEINNSLWSSDLIPIHHKILLWFEFRSIKIFTHVFIYLTKRK